MTMVCIGLCSAQIALGQSPTYYNFYPQTVLTLGIGFDPTHLDVAKVPCVTFKEKPLDKGSLSTVAEISLVQSMNEMRTSLHLDMEAEASFLAFKGNSHFSVDASYQFQATDATLVLYFASEFPRLGIDSPALLPSAQAMLDSKNFADFENTCGSQMVMIQRQGASVAVVLTIHNVDTGVKAKLRTAVSGGVDLGFLSGSAKADVTAELDSASHEGRLSFKLLASGGDGFGTLSGVLSNITGSTSDVLGQVTKAIDAYLKTFTTANAAPLGFHVGPMLGHTRTYGDLWGDEKRYRLLSLVDSYRHYAAVRDDVTTILGGGDPRDELLTSQQKKELQLLLGTTSKYLAIVATTHAKCKLATQDNDSACTISVSAPTIPSYYQPVVEVTYRAAVVVDGTVLGRTRSQLVMHTPGTNLTWVQKAKPIVPTAKSVWEAYVFESPFLVDVDLVLQWNDSRLGVDQKIFHKGSSNGSVFLKVTQPSLILSVTETSDNGLPMQPDIDVRRIAADFYHLCVSQNIPINSKAKLQAGTRDLLGQVRKFDLAEFEFRSNDSGQVTVVSNRFLGFYHFYYQWDFQDVK